MASEIVGELRRGSGTVRRGDNGRLNVTMQVDFLVVTDDKSTTREEVLLDTANAPIVGLNYGPLGIPCVSKTATRNETNPLYWELSCEFDSAIENQEPNAENPNNPDPTTWVPIWKIEPGLEDIGTWSRDYLSQLYANTAGELYDPPVSRVARSASWVFNQYEPASTSGIEIMKRHNTVNDATFTKKLRGIGMLIEQYTYLMTVEEAELGYYMGFLCWNIKYKLHYKHFIVTQNNVDTAMGWKTVLFSHGFNFWNGTALEPWLEKGINIDGPLDINGGKGTIGQEGHRQEFLFYKPLDWSSFLR